MGDSPERVVSEGLGWVRSTWPRLAPYLVPATAFCAAFPATINPPTPYLQKLLHVTVVPAYVQAAVVGVLAAIAVAVAPTRPWPVLLVGAVDVAIRSSGLVVARVQIALLVRDADAV
jgi:hypothetical protein